MCRLRMAYSNNANRKQLANSYGLTPKSINRNAAFVADVYLAKQLAYVERLLAMCSEVPSGPQCTRQLRLHDASPAGLHPTPGYGLLVCSTSGVRSTTHPVFVLMRASFRSGIDPGDLARATSRLYQTKTAL